MLAYNLVYRYILFPTLISAPHGLMVDHGDGRIPSMHRAVHGSRHSFFQIICTYPLSANSRLTRGRIGAGEFVIGVGGGRIVDAGVGAGAGTGVGVGAGAEAGGTGAKAGAATIGAGVGIGTKMSSSCAAGGFPTAVAGGIKGVCEWCHVTSREKTTFSASASRSIWQSCP